MDGQSFLEREAEIKRQQTDAAKAPAEKK